MWTWVLDCTPYCVSCYECHRIVNIVSLKKAFGQCGGMFVVWLTKLNSYEKHDSVPVLQI